MAAIASAVMGQVMGKSEAEEAFRPWWDNLSDFILYGLAMISVVLLPTALFMTSPLWCNPCLSEEFCGDHNIGDEDMDERWKNLGKSPRVNNYCLHNEVDPLVLHLPYFLISATILLFAIEKVFHSMRRGNIIQNKFFALLVDHEILRSSENKAGNEDLVIGDELEQSRDLMDLKERLENSSSYRRSYLTVQIIETIFSLACCGVLAWKLASDTNGLSLSEPNLYCDFHGRTWECTGHPSAFYTVVMFVTCGMFFLYGLLSFYSIVWSVCRCMRTLNTFVEDNEMEIELSPDFTFLLDLLVLGSGIAPGIAAITVLQPKVLEALKPKRTKLGTPHANQLVTDATLVRESENEVHLTVEIEEPKSGMHAKLENMAKVSYRAELKAVLDDDYQKTEDSLDTPLKRAKLQQKGEIAVKMLKKSKDNSCRQATFLCLLKGEDYILTIKTLLNGFPVGQVTEKFNTDKLGSLLKKELTEDEDDKKEVEEEAPGAQEEKEEDVEGEDPNRLQKQEMEGKEEGMMESEDQ